MTKTRWFWPALGVVICLLPVILIFVLVDFGISVDCKVIDATSKRPIPNARAVVWLMPLPLDFSVPYAVYLEADSDGKLQTDDIFWHIHSAAVLEVVSPDNRVVRIRNFDGHTSVVMPSDSKLPENHLATGCMAYDGFSGSYYHGSIHERLSRRYGNPWLLSE